MRERDWASTKIASWLGREAGVVAETATAATETASRSILTGTKQAVKDGLKSLDLSSAQESKVLGALRRAGNADTVTVERLADDRVLVLTKGTGVDEGQLILKSINQAGQTEHVYQVTRIERGVPVVDPKL